MTSLFNWMYNITSATGQWFLRLTGLSTKKARLLILGLDNAGKTTLLGMLANDQIQCHGPTFHPNNEIVKVGGVEFTAYDLGGHSTARRIWSNYYTDNNCILFMVDSSDHDRFPEARSELAQILADDKGFPILILGNKIDRKDAVNEKELRKELGIEDTDNVGVFMCSVVKREGISEAFKWLSCKI